jgi:hypothetical protein
MQMLRFADGKIVESWAVRDDLGTLRQLGHAPGIPVRTRFLRSSERGFKPPGRRADEIDRRYSTE